jgi:ribonucleoside-diphosphate reductase alpha chain
MPLSEPALTMGLQDGKSVRDMFKSNLRDVVIKEGDKTIFELRGVEAPEAWSDLAVKVVASKYFWKGKNPEKSVFDMVARVSHAIAQSGLTQGHFKDQFEATNFENELAYICLGQHAAFNTPVWFNCGITDDMDVGTNVKEHESSRWRYEYNIGIVPVAPADERKYPLLSACFIVGVKDTLEHILGNVVVEGMIFKNGAGVGANRSAIRSSFELLSGGGRPSGPITYMQIYDTAAKFILSGGRVRRAAKMEILDADHGDVFQFAECKLREERKAAILVQAGYSGGMNGEAYRSVAHQNANHSISIKDEFWKTYEYNLDKKPEARKMYSTIARTTGEKIYEYDPEQLIKTVSNAILECGDPGFFFYDNAQKFHTCKYTDVINASNPCAEFFFIDNSSCNLASINLLTCLRNDGNFDIDKFQHICRVMTIAQDIIVDMGSYPTKEIATNTHKFRPLGLGYANLGSLLMHMGYGYDSHEGRAIAAAISSLMTATAYEQSAKIATAIGQFDGFKDNRKCMLEVIDMHASHNQLLEDMLTVHKTNGTIQNTCRAARMTWDVVKDIGDETGFRNAQVSCIAPTGTIAFMMDCDTTGIEPEMMLVKIKQLAGGGILEIPNKAIPMVLKNLGYDDDFIKSAYDKIKETGNLDDISIKDEHLKVFQCAYPIGKKIPALNWEGHIKMMASVQPFLSGAISKTVNMPKTTTADDIAKAAFYAWKKGLKGLAIFVEGSKGGSAPIKSKDVAEEKKVAKVLEMSWKIEGNGDVKTKVMKLPIFEKLTDEDGNHIAIRKPVPETRPGVHHKFKINKLKGYIHLGFYPDTGNICEIFTTVDKEGTFLSGVLDCWCIAISYALQYGCPFEKLYDKFKFQNFEPNGMVGPNKLVDNPFAYSLIDYIFRWIQFNYPGGKLAHHFDPRNGKEDLPKKEIAEKQPTINTDLLITRCEKCNSTSTAKSGCGYICLTCGHEHKEGCGGGNGII